MRAAIYIWVPHLRDGLIVAKVGGAAIHLWEAR
jgi:hypothetical protein